MSQDIGYSGSRFAGTEDMTSIVVAPSNACSPSKTSHACRASHPVKLTDAVASDTTLLRSLGTCILAYSSEHASSATHPSECSRQQNPTRFVFRHIPTVILTNVFDPFLAIVVLLDFLGGSSPEANDIGVSSMFAFKMNLGRPSSGIVFFESSLSPVLSVFLLDNLDVVSMVG